LTEAGAAERAKERLVGAPYVAYFVALVLIAFLADPYAFTRSWNQGRSAMLAIVPLVLLESGRRSLVPLGSRRKAILGWLTLALAAVYYGCYTQPFVFNAVVGYGDQLGVASSIVQFSWPWGIDYAVTSVFLVALLMLDRGSRTVTPLIYTAGMATFLFIDVVLPENTLGPFGYVVPPILRAVAGVLDWIYPGDAHSSGNILMLHNSQGSMNLQVFWPSAGLDGIVIGLLVVFAICVKVGTGWRRGLAYMLLGAVGSFLVNVVRLVLLALYAMSNITNPQAFQAFHSVVGELIFIPWIVAFIVVIVRREARISGQARPSPPVPVRAPLSGP